MQINRLEKELGGLRGEQGASTGEFVSALVSGAGEGGIREKQPGPIAGRD